MKKSRVFIVFLVFILVLSVFLAACSGKKDKNNKKDDDKDKVVVSSIVDDITPTGKAFNGRLNISTVGQIVTLGNYEQDNDTTNGAEPIEWIVLDVQGDYALVVSKNVLDAKAFCEEPQTTISWEKSSVRMWLVSSFFNEAFSIDEQNRICTIKQDNVDDRIFLLSEEEAAKYFKTNYDRCAKATAYATARGVYTSRGYTEDDADFNGTCRWWLRTVDTENGVAARVRSIGDVYHMGYDVTSDDVGVRPAMWIEKK